MEPGTRLTIQQAYHLLDGHLAERNEDLDVSAGLKRLNEWMRQTAENANAEADSSASRQSPRRGKRRPTTRRAANPIRNRGLRLARATRALAALAIAVLAAVTVNALVLRHPAENPNITDGAHVLAGDLTKVEGLIKAENDRIAHSGRNSISVAFLVPGKPDLAGDAIRHELEGAYLAQYWANHDDAATERLTRRAPLIRLLLASVGEDWHATVAELTNRVRTENLVAVAGGLALGMQAGRRATAELAKTGISVIGPSLTAESPARNAFQVAATTADEPKAAIHQLQSSPEWQQATPGQPYKALLVRDTAANDMYVSTLAEGFHRAFPDDPAHLLLTEHGDFNSEVDAKNSFDSQIQQICAFDPQAVYFAGRSAALREFLKKLAERPCSTRSKITVVSGDDTGALASTRQTWTENSITVLYTGLVSPLSWDLDLASGGLAFSSVTISHFRDGPHSYAALFGDDLHDGMAIMSHDAVLLAIDATRSIFAFRAPQPSETNQNLRANRAPTPTDLVKAIRDIGARSAVPGASGWMYYRAPGEPSGSRPYNKAVPVLRLEPNGRLSLLQISSALGVPAGSPGSS